MNKENFDISLLLVVFTTTIAIWLYLFETIVTLTTNQPTNDLLFTLNSFHFLSFLCIFFSFIILVAKCLNAIKVSKRQTIRLNQIAEKCQKYLFSLWGILLLFSIISLLVTNFFLKVNFKYQFTLIAITSIILTFIILSLFGIKIKIIANELQKIHCKYYITIIIMYLLYFPIIVLLSSGVSFKTEKEFYTENDIIRMEVKPRGYIFLPRIEKVNYGFQIKDAKHGSKNCYYVNLKEYNDNIEAIIEVTYELQILRIQKKDYYFLNVSPI